MRRLRLLAVPVALLVLTGCAGSPRTEVRDDVNTVLAAANDGDAEAVRSAVDELLDTLRAQVGSGDLTAAEAEPVRLAAQAVLESVAELEVEETPSPLPPPPPEETEEPTPTPSPTPSPTPEPTEEPTPTPTPAPTEEPEGTDEPEDEEPVATVPPQELVPTPDTDEEASELPPAGVPTSPAAAPAT